MTQPAQDFNALLAAMLSTENEVRTEAEERFGALPLLERLSHLMGTIKNATGTASEEGRILAAVLFRRQLFNHTEEVRKEVPAETQRQIRTETVAILQDAAIPTSVRRKVADIASELARQSLDDDGNNTWPDFLAFLFQCVSGAAAAPGAAAGAATADPFLKECALNIFAGVPGIFGSQQARYLDVMRQLLVQSLGLGGGNDDIRIAASRALTAFLIVNEEDKEVLKSYGDCLLPLLELIGHLSREELDETPLKNLVDLAEKTPNYLRPQSEAIFQLLLPIAADEAKSDDFRHLSLEVLVSLCEGLASTMRKRLGHHLPPLLKLSLKMMTALEEDPQWALGDEVEEDEVNDEASIGESAIDRLACALGGKIVLPIILGEVPAMLQNPDWRVRRAGLMAISAMGEGCHKQMEAVLGQILDCVLPYVADPHPQCRHAACNALGQMSTDFSPTFEEKFHDKVIPALFSALNDYPHPRVQAHGGAALVNFFEEAPQKILSSYADPIADKLEEVIKAKIKELQERGTKLVLEQMMVTLSSFADTLQENFMRYYDRFVPMLKFVIENAVSAELKVLRGRSIECISLIGLAAGRDRFLADAAAIMDLLLKSQAGQVQMDYDDPMLTYLISSWARICKIMGRQFEPYLPYVMPAVLQAAATKIEISLLDADDVKAMEADKDWQCINFGESQSVGIKTAGLEEKSTACTMLVCYARELQEGFIGYVEDTLKVMVPLLKFLFHEGVRIAAAECMPHLLRVARAGRGPAYLGQVWSFIAPELLKAIETEVDRDVLGEIYDSLAECLKEVGRAHLSGEQMRAALTVMDGHLTEHFQRARERSEKCKDEDYDEGVEETLNDEQEIDVYNLSKMAELLHVIFSEQGADFLAAFEPLARHWVALAAAERPWEDRQWAICVWDDVIEFTGAASEKYEQFFLPVLSRELRSPHPELRQAAAYGWGMLAKAGGPHYATYLAQVLPHLVEVISAAEARNADNLSATDNAVAAVTKILRYNSSALNVDEVLPVWLRWLPIYTDVDELSEVYDYLAERIEQKDVRVLGANNIHLAFIVAVIADVFARGVLEATSPVGQRLVFILKSIKENPALFETVTTGLNGQQKEALGGLQ